MRLRTWGALGSGLSGRLFYPRSSQALSLALLSLLPCPSMTLLSPYFTRGNVSILSAEIYSEVRRKVSPEVNAVSNLLFITVLVLLPLSSTSGRPQAEKRLAQRN